MSTEANKAHFRRMVEQVFTGGNIDLIDELLTDDFVEHEQMEPGAGSGPEAVKQMMAGMRAAFPDLQVTVDSLIAEDDILAARTTWRGTHQGEFMGVPATGKDINLRLFVAAPRSSRNNENQRTTRTFRSRRAVHISGCIQYR